jgi:hypothetical protein
MTYFILGILVGLLGPILIYAIVAQIKTILAVQRIKRAIRKYDDNNIQKC